MKFKGWFLFIPPIAIAFTLIEGARVLANHLVNWFKPLLLTAYAAGLLIGVFLYKL